MKKQKTGIGTLSAIGGSFIGMSISNLDKTSGKIMLGIGIIILILVMIRIIK